MTAGIWRTKINRARRIGAAALVVALTGPVWADDHHVILCGSGGEAEFQELFRSWGTRLRDALVLRLGAPPANVVLLTEPETDNAPHLAATNLDAIRAVFEAMADRVTPDDDLYVYLIGHGSYLKSESKFHIPGADLSAADLDLLMDAVPARRIVLLNGTSSSAGFINELSGAKRVICTATKSISEINAPEFMGFFIEGLEDGSADRNHDERISFLEACEQASELTASWYSSESLLATEHAILDDDGDGLGSRLPIEAFAPEVATDVDATGAALALDGKLAAQCYLKDYTFGSNVPQDLIDTYLAALDEIAALIAKKATIDEAPYYAELERILLKAARANRDIRAYSTERAADS